MSAFDAVVVGSGAGGAPVAERLAKAGMKVLVVERGRSWKREEYDRDEIEWCRRDRFVPSPRTDPHTRRTDEGQRAVPTSDGWISTVVGGGTVHMGGYFLRAPADDFAIGARTKAEIGHTAIDWAVPYDEIAKRYPVAEADLGVSGVGALPALNAHPLAAQVDAACGKLGFSSTPTPRAILTTARPDEDRRACTYHDLCASYGCPEDAKGSTQATYLRRGAKTGNLVVREQTMAVKIEHAGGAATGVRVRDLTTGAEETIAAGLVVVACGAIETARLLLLSDLNASGQVGKHLWFSLFVETTGFLPGTDALRSGSPFLNRTIRAHRDATGQVAFVHDNPIHRAERVATDGGLVWGRALKEKLLRSFTRGRMLHVEGFGESLPHPGAYVDLDPTTKDKQGLPAARITYFHHERDKRVAGETAEAQRKLLENLGCVDVRTTRPVSETLVLQGGTARFSTDEKSGACDVDGRVRGAKNVYVTDGAALPSSTTVPITLTIVANALRTADGILKRG